MKIYLAGPYSPTEYTTTVDHIKSARSVLIDIMRLGITVFCPHTHTAFLEEDAPDITWDMHMECCCAWLKCCDGVYMLPGWENSKGSLIEKELAEELGIPVYYSYEELPIVLRHQSVEVGDDNEQMPQVD